MIIKSLNVIFDVFLKENNNPNRNRFIALTKPSSLRQPQNAEPLRTAGAARSRRFAARCIVRGISQSEGTG